MSKLWLMAVFVLLGSPERLARAQPAAATPTHTAASESDRLIEEGLQLREAGRDAEALPLFEEASRLGASPRAFAQLALAHQALGDWVEAERGLTTALQAADDPWVAQRRAVLDAALARVQEHLGWLEIESNVRGAVVRVNDAVVGSAPIEAPVRVAEGSVHVTASAAGRAPITRLVRIVAGQRAHEAFDFAPDPAPASDAAAAPATAQPGHDETPSPPPPPEKPNRTLAWVAAGGSAAFLGGAIAASAVRESAASSWNDNAKCLQGTATRQTTCSQYQSTVNTATAVSVAGYATSGALALASLYLFLRSPTAPSSASRAPASRAFVPVCAPGFLALSCSGTF